MNNTTWKQSWLLLLIAIGCATIGLSKVVAQDDRTNAAGAELVELVITNEPATPQEPDGPWERKWAFKNNFDKNASTRRRDEVVVFGRNVVLKSNETAETVVVIGGSATVQGNVRDAVVAIGGDVTVEGAEVGEAVVAVLGNVNIKSNSIINGDVVSVGGTVEVADDATVTGHIQPVDFGGFGLPHMEWLKEWLVQCVLKLRPLALGPHLGWIWAVAGVFFLLYLLVAAAMPRTVEVCVNELTRRPATTFLMGLFTKILLPFVLLILIATGIGVIVIPFLFAALLFGALIGKVAFLEYLGQSLGRTFGGSVAVKPFLALLIGSIVLVLLYLVPVLGLIIFAVTGLWGLGAAVLALFGGMRRESPDRAVSSGVPPMSGPTGLPTGIVPTTAAAGAAAYFASNVPPIAEPIPGVISGNSPESAPAPNPMTVPPGVARISEALALPRASFLERMGAALLDVILASFLAAVIIHIPSGRAGGPPMFFLLMLAYFVGLWTWRGTTVGGIVLNLKVVRLDDQPISLVVALVRGLAAAFSTVVLFLGFFWMTWDREKQTWHDKIAGTVVVRQPRGSSLV